MISDEIKKLFHSRTEQQGEHVVWTGPGVPRGHGAIAIDGEEVHAHRVAFCIAHHLELEEIESFQIDRMCLRHGCVNPEHLAKKPKRKYFQSA